MRLIGIDPGLTRCGVGIIDVDNRRKATLVHVEVIQTPPSAPIPERLALLNSQLIALIEQFDPNSMAIERVFSQHNKSTVMGTAQASAIAMLIAQTHQIPVSMYTPTEVKAAVSGSGRADKAQVANMVSRILGTASLPKLADATDALALSLCHAYKNPSSNALAALLSGAGK